MLMTVPSKFQACHEQSSTEAKRHCVCGVSIPRWCGQGCCGSRAPTVCYSNFQFNPDAVVQAWEACIDGLIDYNVTTLQRWQWGRRASGWASSRSGPCSNTAGSAHIGGAEGCEGGSQGQPQPVPGEHIQSSWSADSAPYAAHSLYRIAYALCMPTHLNLRL